MATAIVEQRPEWSVALVSMPFMDVYRPSIQLGLLKSLAIAHGFPARTLHASLSFASQIGVDYYQLLAEHRGHMVGEWLFSLAAFPGAAPDPDSRMVDELADDLSYLDLPQDELREKLTRTRNVDVPAYLEMLVDSMSHGIYTFEDTLADLFLACTHRPTTAVRRKLDLPLPVEGIQEIFQEFQQRGLMFLDGQFALALALPGVKWR